MGRPAFDALDTDWVAFARSSVAMTALDRWRTDAELVASSLE